MKAEIINVGEELLSGNTLNSNVQVLSKLLSPLGIKLNFNAVVGDVEEHIISATEMALQRSDLIIYTGGLGPTKDDLTKEVVCKALDIELSLDNEILENIKEFFKSRDIEMTNNNIKQALVPEGSTILKNKNGTAPGFFLNYDNKSIVLLPGPPREIDPMFREQVVPLISELTNNKIVSKNISTIGIGESKLEDMIEDIISFYKPVDIATYARNGQVDIRITISSEDENEANKLMCEICERIEAKLEKFIYSYENEKIEEVVSRLLRENNLKVGFCESCTGGLVTSKITKFAGASDVLDRSIITYSNDSKMEEVSVKKETLDEHGAVSSETAIEMAKGMLLRSNIDIAVSITGVAGPDGGSPDKPVGLVYICLATRNTQIVEKNIFIGSRFFVQERTSVEVFNLIRKHILTDLQK